MGVVCESCHNVYLKICAEVLQFFHYLQNIILNETDFLAEFSKLVTKT